MNTRLWVEHERFSVIAADGTTSIVIGGEACVGEQRLRGYFLSNGTPLRRSDRATFVQERPYKVFALVA